MRVGACTSNKRVREWVARGQERSGEEGVAALPCTTYLLTYLPTYLLTLRRRRDRGHVALSLVTLPLPLPLPLPYP